MRTARRHSLWLLAIFATAGVAVLAAIYLGDDTDPLASRSSDLHQPTAREKSNPSIRVSDAPQIVGVDVCAKCHASKVQDLTTSGHSRTFIHSSRSAAARALDGRTFADPDRKYTYRYHFDAKEGLSVSIPGRTERRFPLQYALGSGNHAVTFYSLVAMGQPDGTVAPVGVEHRVSAFPHATKNSLELTPGQRGLRPKLDIDDFGKTQKLSEAQQCIDCHTTSSKLIGTDIEGLRENVTCENCHGPGSQHVAAAERGERQPGFLQLTSTSHDGEAQIRLCGRCHRVPEMMEGSPIHRSDAQITRFQPVGLLQSRCFKESQGEMSCSTCHDPHRGTSHDKQQYVLQCLKCHQPDRKRFSVCPISASADCLRCHMPAVPSVYEVAFTDHWIRVRNNEDPQPPNHPIPLPKRARKPQK